MCHSRSRPRRFPRRLSSPACRLLFFTLHSFFLYSSIAGVISGGYTALPGVFPFGQCFVTVG